MKTDKPDQGAEKELAEWRERKRKADASGQRGMATIAEQKLAAIRKAIAE